MPRFGKDYKMYRRTIPSLELDITDILETGKGLCLSLTHSCLYVYK